RVPGPFSCVHALQSNGTPVNSPESVVPATSLKLRISLVEWPVVKPIERLMPVAPSSPQGVEVSCVSSTGKPLMMPFGSGAITSVPGGETTVSCTPSMGPLHTPGCGRFGPSTVPCMSAHFSAVKQVPAGQSVSPLHDCPSLSPPEQAPTTPMLWSCVT